MKYFELEVIMTMYSEKQDFHVQNIDNCGKKDARIGIVVFTQNKEVLSNNSFLLIDKRYTLEPSKSYNFVIKLTVDEKNIQHIKLQNEIIIQIGINNFANAIIKNIKEI